MHIRQILELVESIVPRVSAQIISRLVMQAKGSQKDTTTARWS
jgi:hypothetical protein